MKLFIIAYLLVISTTMAQKHKVQYEQVKDSSLISLLNKINLLEEYETNELFVRIYQLINEPGSAGFDNGEVTSEIYIAVSEYGEYPDQNLFIIHSLYAPKVVKINEMNGNIVLYLNYIEEQEIALKIEITLENIKLNTIKETNSQHDSHSINVSEEFTKFISKFTKDSTFQISRVKFPLEKEVFKDNQFSEIENRMINVNEWEHLVLFSNMEYNIQLYDNNECNLSDTDERVVAYEGNENGINQKYYFKRTNGKWYLIKIIDLST